MLNALFNANSLHKSNIGRFEKRLILVGSIQSQIVVGVKIVDDVSVVAHSSVQVKIQSELHVIFKFKHGPVV